MDNVITFPAAEPVDSVDTPRIDLSEVGQRIDAAYKRLRGGREDWVEGSLALAAALATARDCFAGDTKFGQWLRDHKHDHLNVGDRGALIKFGRNLAQARIILENTSRNSYAWLWRTLPVSGQIAFSAPHTANLTWTWTAERDKRLRQLRVDEKRSFLECASILTTEFNLSVREKQCVNRAYRLDLPTVRKAAVPTPSPRRNTLAPRKQLYSLLPTEAGPTKHLTQAEVDPEFTGTGADWIRKHGHVQIRTAEQVARDGFAHWTACARAAVQAWQKLGELNRPVDLDWLRSPKERDTVRLTEALEFLRPRMAEAEALLARAMEVRGVRTP